MKNTSPCKRPILDIRVIEDKHLARVLDSTLDFRQLPEHLLTFEMCAYILERMPLILEFVPKRLMTVELVVATVKSDRRAIQFVPYPQFLDIYAELAIPIINTFSFDMGYLDKDFIRVEGVKLLGLESIVFAFIRPELRTPEIVEAALMKDRSTIQYCKGGELLPEHLRHFFSDPGSWYMLSPHAKLLGQLLQERPDLAPLPKPDSLRQIYDGFQQMAAEVKERRHMHSVIYYAYLSHFQAHEVAPLISTGEEYAKMLGIFSEDALQAACLKHEQTRDYVLEHDLGL
jgi:hypothetical protein